MDDTWVAGVLARARVARLGTAGSDGVVRMVPICFAIVDDWIVGAVDHKPKRTGQLRRLDDMAETGSATVLIDEWNEDWSQLWWLRIRGRAEVLSDDDPASTAARIALTAKYQQYADRPPTGAVYRIALDELRWWRGTGR